jgi:hypothetical protein
MTALERARYYRALGLSVIPVPRADGRHDGKVPALAWKDYQTRLPTDDELVSWFSGPPMNLAIITGTVSGVVVIDADSPEALRYLVKWLPYTPWQTKTGKGWHLFYGHPGVSVPNRARIETRGGKQAIDVRGDGGYVIAPGSVHANGTPYRATGDWSIARAEIPRFWPGWLASPKRPPVAPTPLPRPTGDLVTRARAYLHAIPRPVIGEGSDEAVFRAACKLGRGFGLPETDTTSLLWEWCGHRPGWTYAWVASKVRSAMLHGHEAIGGRR